MITEKRVRELRDQAYNGYVDDWDGDTHDEIAKICDLALRALEGEKDADNFGHGVWNRPGDPNVTVYTIDTDKITGNHGHFQMVLMNAHQRALDQVRSPAREVGEVVMPEPAKRYYAEELYDVVAQGVHPDLERQEVVLVHDYNHLRFEHKAVLLANSMLVARYAALRSSPVDTAQGECKTCSGSGEVGPILFLRPCHVCDGTGRTPAAEVAKP